MHVVILVVPHLLPCMLGWVQRCSLEICNYFVIVKWSFFLLAASNVCDHWHREWWFTIVCANLTTYVARGVDSDFQAVIENLLLIIKRWPTQLKHVKLNRRNHGSIARVYTPNPILSTAGSETKTLIKHGTVQRIKLVAARTWYHEFFSSVLQDSL